MEREEKRVVRILYIIKVLWEETDEAHPMSASRISKRMAQYGVGCERKAVYRYLEELAEFGFDIVRTRQGAYLASRQFELPELKLLADAVQASKFITAKKSEELISKLGKLLSRHDSDRLRRQIYIKNRAKTMNESIYYNVDAVFEGIQRNCQITFTYWNWNMKKEMQIKHNGKEYVISPWIMIWEDEKYYMVGYDEEAKQLKHFRVDKMRQIMVREKPRMGRELFEQLKLSSCSVSTFGMFQGRREAVTLLADRELAGVVIDRFGKAVWMHPVDDEHFTVTAEVMVSNQFFGWVAGLGGRVKITAPVWVVEEYKELIFQLMKSMDENGV